MSQQAAALEPSKGASTSSLVRRRPILIFDLSERAVSAFRNDTREIQNSLTAITLTCVTLAGSKGVGIG